MLCLSLFLRLFIYLYIHFGLVWFESVAVLATKHSEELSGDNDIKTFSVGLCKRTIKVHMNWDIGIENLRN
jgi:hypothetical protein